MIVTKENIGIVAHEVILNHLNTQFTLINQTTYSELYKQLKNERFKPTSYYYLQIEDNIATAVYDNYTWQVFSVNDLVALLNAQNVFYTYIYTHILYIYLYYNMPTKVTRMLNNNIISISIYLQYTAATGPKT